MNPILASTVEFNDYVREKVKASRSGLDHGIAGQKSTLSGQKATRSSSASIQRRNTEKYHLEPKLKYNETTGSRISARDIPIVSPKFEISHSWRGHLKTERKVTIPTASSTQSKVLSPQNRDNEKSFTSTYWESARPESQREVWRYNESKYTSLLEEDSDAPPYLDALNNSFHHSMSIRDSVYESYDVKIRTFRLKKLFRAWRAQVLAALPQQRRLERSVSNFCQENRLVVFFDSWRNYWQAIVFHKHFISNRIPSLFSKWLQRSRTKRRSIMRVKRHRLRRAFQRFRTFLAHCQQLHVLRQLKTRAKGIRAKFLLKPCWRRWKKLFQQMRTTRELDASRRTTQSRIHSFMQRLDSAAASTSTSAVATNITDGHAPPRSQSRSRSGLRGGAMAKSGPSSAIASRLHPQQPRQQSARKQREDRVSEGKTSEASFLKADALESDNLPPSPSKKKRVVSQESSPHSYLDTAEDLPQRGDESLPRSVPPPQPLMLSRPRTVQASSLSSSDQPNQLPQQPTTRWTPPPSYHNFLDTDTAEAFPVQPPSVSSSSTRSKQQQQQEESEKSKPVVDLSQLSRKERLQVLQQQAQERVQQRQLELRRQKEEREERAEAETLKQLEETRNKRQQQREMTLKYRQHQLHIQQQQQQQTNGTGPTRPPTALQQRADAYRHRSLLVSRGWAPWMRLLQFRRRQQQIAIRYAQRTQTRRVYIRWLAYARALKTARVRREYSLTVLAQSHYQRHLLLLHWKYWRMYKRLLQARAKAVTGHFSRYTLPKRCFLAWRVALERHQRQTQMQMRRVSDRGDNVTRRFYWRRWLQYQQQQQIQREVDLRSERKWQAVRSWMHK